MDLVREIELEKDVEGQQEEKGDALTRRWEYENQIQNATSLKEIELIMNEKYKNEDLKLRVYIDRENEKYYIDTFAAFSLGLLSYGKACTRYDSGATLYEISSEMLNMLERVFSGKIEYQYLPAKKKNGSEVNYFDNYTGDLNKYNDLKKLSPEDNNRFDNIRNVKDELSAIFNPSHNDLIDFRADIDLENHKYNK